MVPLIPIDRCRTGKVSVHTDVSVPMIASLNGNFRLSFPAASDS